MLPKRSGRDRLRARAVGQWIGEQREKALGMAQGELAEFLDVTRTSVNKWENGRPSVPIAKVVAVYRLVQLTREGVRDRGELRERLDEFMGQV